MKKISKELKYYYKNREKLIKKSIQYQKDNPEKIKQSQLKYTYSPKGVYNQIKKNSKKNGLPLMKQSDFIEWYDNQQRVCGYCGVCENKLSTIIIYGLRSKRLTIDRIDNLKGYEQKNLILACDLCNKVKSNIFTRQEMIAIGKHIKQKYDNI